MDRVDYFEYSSEEEPEYQEPKKDIEDIENFYKELKDYLKETYSLILDDLKFNNFVQFVKKQNPEEFSHV